MQPIAADGATNGGLTRAVRGCLLSCWERVCLCLPFYLLTGRLTCCNIAVQSFVHHPAMLCEAAVQG